MSLSLEQIEHLERWLGAKKSKSRKWLKNQRNRKIRRADKTEVPHVKYKGWEW